MADHDIIFRVLQNLLANAIKFTPRKGGLIRLAIEPSQDRVRVSFQDNGPGIAPEYRQKIFEKFGQVELRASRQINSTGLGLTFSKLAVEAHGGRIGVDSEAGKGSSFWFELPVNGPVPSEEAATVSGGA
jgi:signal transduction histidine kinase